MILYMAVTPDEYELPLCVAESPAELGQMMGRSKKSVLEAIARRRSALATNEGRRNNMEVENG